MSDVLVSPLVVVREHAGGMVSAHPAAEPSLVCFGSDREGVLSELRLFLSSYLPRAGVEVVERLIVPEEASVDEVTAALPYGPVRARRVRTAVGFSALFVGVRRDARWVLIPALDHVCYVPGERLHETHAIAAREVERRLHASDFDGGAYLELLPPLSTSIERLEVELEISAEQAARASAASVAERKRREARKLLERIGRPMTPGGRTPLHRAEATAAVRSLLESDERTSVVLVGPEGAGKSALVRAAVGTRTAPLSRPVYVTSGAELVAGQSFVGQLEEQVEAVMKAVELLDAVLYFETLDDLFAGRQGGYQDLGSLMRRFVAGGRIRLLGELTAERYDRLQHQNVSFFSYLQKLEVAPLTRAQTLEVLLTRRMNRDAASVLLDLTERYYPDAALPGGATRFADELGSLHSGEIQTDDVYRATSARTGVPEFLLRDERSLVLADIASFFRSQVICQTEAITQVAEVLCRVKAGVSPRNRPLATFLFVGPTGVGKTELAKVLARYLFGSADRLARFDMSEYRGPLAAERLIRGTDREDGVLTRRIREQPFTVLLLDEIEKADPGVFDLLLQVCGEGRLSDAQGRLAHFTNAIIIMTSNLGSQHQNAPPGFASVPGLGRDHYVREVREHFRPEFVNRLDRIVAFESLTRDEMREVTELSIERIRRREGLEERSVTLSVSPGALLELAENGYSGAYGARGLRRYLEHALVAPASTVLAGLGARAAGASLSVRLPGEPEAVDGVSAGVVELGGLVITAFARPDPKRRNASGAVEISRLRREVAGFSRLAPIAEIRERAAELTAELTTPERSKASRVLGRVLGELTAELGRLDELLRPLDEARRELETIESMVVAGLAEGGAPELFADDARRAHARFSGHLIPALLARSAEHEVTLVAHELDDQRVLQRWVLPLLEYARKKRWQVLVHVDRDPELARDRRWGPPRPPEDYVERFGKAAEPPFRNVLLRVKGHAAGALLSFMSGRWIYPQPKTPGEIWVRIGAARYELSQEALEHQRLAPVIERAVGRKQPMCFDLRPDAEQEMGARDVWFEEVTEESFYDHYERMLLPNVIDVAARGALYLPEIP
jgi:ATP-dependent Clp protease ATP-binding subunit ClpC